MTQPAITVGPTSPLREVIQLMETKHIRHVAVVEDSGHLLGLISHRDVLRSQEGSLSGALSSEQVHMNRWIEARWIDQGLLRALPPRFPKGRILIVPGNHDVDRSAVKRSADLLQKDLLDSRSQDDIAHVLDDPDERALLLKRKIEA